MKYFHNFLKKVIYFLSRIRVLKICKFGKEDCKGGRLCTNKYGIQGVIHCTVIYILKHNYVRHHCSLKLNEQVWQAIKMTQSFTCVTLFP